jgi:hypothetical protein
LGIRDAQAPARPPDRDGKEILTEILDVVRSLGRRATQSDLEQLLLERALSESRDRTSLAPSLAGLYAAVGELMRTDDARVKGTTQIVDPLQPEGDKHKP